MSTSSFPSLLAYYVESTQGLAPASAAAWVTAAGAIATGARMRHIGESLDVAGIQQAVVEDERSQVNIFGLNVKVKGLRNVTFPMKMYLTGMGAVTAPASQAVATAQSVLLTHCLGGSHRSNSTLLTAAGTTTVLNVTAATNIIPGCLIAVEDISAPGVINVRRVLSVAALAVTIDEALTFTPVAGDICHATITHYIDESVLVDSSVGPTTMSWLIQKGLPAAIEGWVLRGCKTELKSIELERGGLPTMTFETQCAAFDGPQTAPSPTWSTTTIHGNAPVSIGPDSIWSYQTYGSTVTNNIHVSASTIDVGVPVVAIDTNTEVTDDMEGRQAYTTQPADTMCSLSVVPMATAPWTDFSADTFKRVRFFKRAAAGSGIAIHFSRCEFAEMPKRGVNGAVSSIDIALRAHPDLDNASATIPAMWVSKVLIAQF